MGIDRLLRPQWLLVAVVFAGGAEAQDSSIGSGQAFPAKSIRIIVGPGPDIIARLFGQKFAETWGHQTIVEQRPGGGGTIALEFVAKSPPDGYTLFLGSISNAISAALYPKLNFDIVRDFAPVTLLATTPGVLVVHPALPVKTVKEFVALAKAKPGTLNYSSAGIGSSSHLAPELLAMMTGINIVHVPYKGGGPGLVDLLSGQMQFMMTTTPAAMPHVKSGKVRALGVTSAKRSQSLPELPTIAEAGVKGYEVSTWYGVLAPAKTSKTIVTRLHGEIIKLIAVPDTKEKLLSQGFEPVGSTPDEFGAYIKSEIAKWAKVIKTAKIKAE